MAKTNMLQREKRREALIKKHAVKRAKLRELIRDPRSSPEQRVAAQESLQKLPRDSNPNRKRNRCSVTGRSRGVYRKFGLGRVKLREAAVGSPGTELEFAL